LLIILPKSTKEKLKTITDEINRLTNIYNVILTTVCEINNYEGSFKLTETYDIEIKDDDTEITILK
jgi:hypothetical protein